ncbi:MULTISPECIES: hypothetical protein [Sphingobacterium]|uniref:hypothetical protein n=1 Tax=Sphingobacterium TaxID=28453 RepID=UPI0028A7F7F8|nr:hypothetical protein [Sphingobacterium multivorum]
MRTNVLSFFSSGSVAESFAKAWETIGSKLGLSINIQLNNRRPNDDVLIQESLIPISKTTSKNLSNNVQLDSLAPCFHNTDL